MALREFYLLRNVRKKFIKGGVLREREREREILYRIRYEIPNVDVEITLLSC